MKIIEILSQHRRISQQKLFAKIVEVRKFSSMVMMIEIIMTM